ncbi:MAG TPA: DUF484 family protein [Acetobacteraceae bacterium]|jgi:uncharacterized protein YigA (DUF484 family)|nr:DUF484 family protein [Acetobacteraceae bacterium]
MAEPAKAVTPSAEAVIAYLRAHPAFLASNPGLYGALEPPRRVHGPVLADHMAAMLAAERGRAVELSARADGVLAAGRAAAGLAARVQEAVLALLRAQDVADCIAAEMPALLAVDAATLCLEGDLPGARRLPAGSVARLLGQRSALFRSHAPSDNGADAQLLHGEAARLARHEALLLVPGEGPPALVALVARAAEVLDPAQGIGALTFLGRAVAAALDR